MLFGGVAQLGERLLCTQKVAGSIPVTSTTGYRKVWFNPLLLERRDRKFKSCYPDQKIENYAVVTE